MRKKEKETERSRFQEATASKLGLIHKKITNLQLETNQTQGSSNIRAEERLLMMSERTRDHEGESDDFLRNFQNFSQSLPHKGTTDRNVDQVLMPLKTPGGHSPSSGNNKPRRNDHIEIHVNFFSRETTKKLGNKANEKTMRRGKDIKKKGRKKKGTRNFRASPATDDSMVSINYLNKFYTKASLTVDRRKRMEYSIQKIETNSLFATRACAVRNDSRTFSARLRRREDYQEKKKEEQEQQQQQQPL